METDTREDEEVGGDDVIMYHIYEGDDPSWISSNQGTHGNDDDFDEHVVGNSGFTPMQPCNFFADEAGPSSYRQHPLQSVDVHPIFDYDETSDDDEHLIRRTVLTPPSKRQRLNVLDPSRA